MAREITFNLTASLKNGYLNSAFTPTAAGGGQAQFDQTNQGIQVGVLTVTTSGVSVPVDLLTQPGFVSLLNLDESVVVRVGNFDGSTFRPLLKLRAGGGFTVFEMDSSGSPVIRLKTDSGTAKVTFQVWES